MGCLQQEIIDCIDTKFHHTVNILDIPYISIVKLLYFHYKKNGDVEDSCVALHDFYGFAYG